MITSALFTDFYELTMAQGYWKQGMNHEVVFDMFFRRQPFNGGFSVFAGIETLLDVLTAFRFSDEDIAYLQAQGIFEQGFLDYLKTFRFSGDLYSFEEGSIIFPQEPMVRIHAKLIEAQIIEGLVLNHCNFQSLIATKTARVWLASKKGNIMEFGLRRAQGPDAGTYGARAGIDGTALRQGNDNADFRREIPPDGRNGREAGRRKRRVCHGRKRTLRVKRPHARRYGKRETAYDNGRLSHGRDAQNRRNQERKRAKSDLLQRPGADFDRAPVRQGNDDAD